jgi:hypothetical protein
MKRLISTAVFILTNSILFIIQAQPQFTGWMASFNTIRTGKKISMHADMQIRSNNQWKQTQTILLRPGINYHLNKKTIITVGYAFINSKRTVNNVSGFIPENRIWEQLIYNHKVKNFFISQRFRLEQRFISKIIVSNNELEANGVVYANRFRYFNRNILPIRKVDAFKKGIFVALQNEVFINIGNTANVNGEFFDQNRLYIATGYRIHPKADIEIGYMNQYVNGRGIQFTNNHVLQLASYLRL